MNRKMILPIGLLVGLIIAYFNADIGIFLKNMDMVGVLAGVIFLVYGYTIDFKKLKFGKKTFYSILIIILLNLVIIPLVGFCIGYIFLSGLSLLGFIIIVSMPPTLSSGVVMTENSDGNVILALVFTLVLNLVGIFIIPLLFNITLMHYGNVTINPINILISLVYVILIPIIVGAILKIVISKYAKNSVVLLMPNLCVIIITFICLSTAMSTLKNSSFNILLLIVLAAIIAHLIFISITYFTSVKILKEDVKNIKAFVFVGSQKTLPIAMFVLLAIMNKNSSEASSVIVIFYFMQLIIDSFISAKMGKKKDVRL